MGPLGDRLGPTGPVEIGVEPSGYLLRVVGEQVPVWSTMRRDRPKTRKQLLEPSGVTLSSLSDIVLSRNVLAVRRRGARVRAMVRHPPRSRTERGLMRMSPTTR